MKRAISGLFALIATAFLAVPAQAAPSQSNIQGAEAIWYFDNGGVATAVLIRPVEQKDSRGSTIEGVNVQVTEESVDPSTGDVTVQLYASDPYYSPATSLSVDGLKGAAVHATVRLFDQVGSTGPFTVTVTAAWTPDGGRTHTLNTAWDTEFGAWRLNRTNQSMVPAVATGSVTGDLNFGSLGEVEGVLGTAHSFFMFKPQPALSALSAMAGIYASEARSVYHITGASVTFDAGDTRGTQVSLDVQQDHDAVGRSVAVASIEISGGWCETATDTAVTYDVSSAATAVTGSADPSLQRANLAGTFTVTGLEYRQPGCDVPTGDSTWSDIGPFTVTVSAEWSATGALTHYRTLFIERSPDLATKARYSSTARQATAAGTIAGYVSASLTNVQNAILYDQTRTYTVR